LKSITKYFPDTCNSRIIFYKAISTNDDKRMSRRYARLLVLFLVPYCAHAQVGSLKDAAQQAVLSNPEVLARFHALEAAKAERDAAFGGFLPRVDVSATTGRERRYDNPALRNSISQRSDAITLTQLLFDGFATYNDVKRLDHASLVRLFELYDASETVALEVVRAYIDVLRYRTLVEMAEENYVRHRSVFEQIQKKAAAGVGRRVDLEQAAGRLALSEANLLTDTANLHDVSARFQRLVGMPPLGALPPPSGLNKGMPADVREAMETAVGRNPAILASVENVRAANRAASARYADYQPRVELRLSSARGDNLGGGVGESHDNSAQVVLNWNLFNGLSDRARVRQFAEQLNVARDQRDRACRDMRQTLLIAMNDTVKLTEQLIYFDQHQLAIEKARDAYRMQFDIGQRTLLDVLDTENELFSARRAYANAEYDREIAYARVHAGMGNLFTRLGLSRNDLGDLPKRLGGDEAERINACPLEGPLPYAVDKAALNARAAEILKESAAVAAQASRSGPGPGAAGQLGTPQPLQANATEAAAKAVSNALSAWISAWEARDIAAYLTSYSPDFQTSGNVTRQAWEAQRRSALSKASQVDVNISDLRIDVLDQGHAVTRFVQTYRSATYGDVVYKTLEWENIGGKWLISRELVRPTASQALPN
jgi:adhesin transport system outer membrane protein